MSWLQKLYETYENNTARVGDEADAVPLLPPFHTTQNANVQVAIDESGRFLRARVLTKDEASTVVPATEESSGRTSGYVPHPLFDKLQYIARDYKKYGGTDVRYKYDEYCAQLKKWCDSDQAHTKVRSVLRYVERGTMIADLVEASILYAGKDGRLLDAWPKDAGEPPKTFKLLPKQTKQIEVFVRFTVETPGDPVNALWRDQTVWQSWIDYYSKRESIEGYCYVTATKRPLAASHPKKIRNSGDGAKLISSNDTKGFTYRGRFNPPEKGFDPSLMPCSVGAEITHKAHSALRWLIKRQGYHDDTLAVVAWAIGGGEIPRPFWSTYEIFGEGDAADEASEDNALRDEGTAQAFGRRLAASMAGYASTIGETAEIVVMAVDSATTGRMAICYYRKLTGSEFLERIEAWHRDCSWQQMFAKGQEFIGAPAPQEISRALYGVHVGKEAQKVQRATVKRLLPCIIDDAPLPRDIVESAVRQAYRPMAFKNDKKGIRWDWEKALGIACSLYRYQHKERKYQMTLERDRHTRDYLYGRLLALAHDLENSALGLAKEERDTNAMRLMQRFADRPASTWRTIELALSPYRARLKANMGGVLYLLEQEIDEVMIAFNPDEFASDSPLSGEFLLGFHCERAQQQLRRKKKKSDKEQQDTETASTLA